MTLTIHKFSTHCRSPKSIERERALVDDVARGPLVSELAAQLGPSLDRSPTIVRIRTLRVKLAIPSRQLNANLLADRWARALTLALHEALAYPEGSGAVPIRHFRSRAEYTSALIRHLLTEGTAHTWQFPELVEVHGQPAPQAALHLLRGSAEIAETIACLSRAQWLDPLLGLFDELQLEQLMQAIAEFEGSDRGMDLSALIELGQSMATPGVVNSQWSMASRRQAVRLWSRLPAHFPHFPLRTIWHGMRLLVRLLENPELLSNADATLSAAAPFPEWCEDRVREAAALPRDEPSVAGDAFRSVLGPDSRQLRDARAALIAVLSDLHPLLPTAAKVGRSSRWVESQNCGILLLLSTVQRIQMFRLAFTPEFEQFGGPRAFSFLLAAIGMTLAGDGDLDSDHPIDPAVLLFAGIFAEVDRAGMKQFFAKSDVRAISQRVQAERWPDALQVLASDLARNFAQRIRGFRQASPYAVVKQFVRTSGRVLVEDDRLLVTLSPSPWAVALRISAMDESISNIEWLSGKRVDFVLEGL